MREQSKANAKLIVSFSLRIKEYDFDPKKQ